MLDTGQFERWLSTYHIRERAQERFWSLFPAYQQEHLALWRETIDDEFDEKRVIASLEQIELALSPWPDYVRARVSVHIDVRYRDTYYKRKSGEKIFYTDDKDYLTDLGYYHVCFALSGEIEEEQLKRTLREV